MKTVRWLGAGLMATTLALATSCTAAILVGGVAAGAAGTAYVMMDLEAVEAASLDRVYAATLEALTEAGIFVTKKSKTALGASITARGAEDRKITIKLKPVSRTYTEIKIRVGHLGDERKSRQLHELIKKQLAWPADEE